MEKLDPIRLQHIGSYELLRPLGRGGMGLVMLARHATLKKQVAIKILPSLVGDRPELVQRFQREILTAGQLSHPSIVHATDAGAEQGTHYLVMEYIDGLDLSRLARLADSLSIANACELMRQTALGLSYAHAQGVVHRDIKPSNLMLDTAGRVKILDFGLAQLSLWEDAACELTTVGQLMGTLDYMAPEQAERSGPVDYRADLYALGATLFRLLTGRAPLAASPHMTLLEKVRLLGSHSPPLVSTLREDCPAQLASLIEQLLSRDPNKRPASAAHVAEALLPFCSGHDVVELLATCRQRATAEPIVENAPAFVPHVGIAPPAKPPRRAWLALAWLSPIAILAGILITLETQKGQLVIESDVAGVKVNVLQDGKVYQQLQVQTGAQSTRLLADKYAIEIDGARDEVVIDQSNVEIRRGDTVVARIRQKSKAARTDLDLSHVYDFIGVGDVLEKEKAASQSNLPLEPYIAYLEVKAARARLEQLKKEADALTAELAQKAYEHELAKSLFPKGLVSELEYNEKRNRWEQAKSKLQKAEAQASEFAITLSAKELALESKVNAADVKNRESATGVTVAAQPMYAGQTLSQWLDVLERDLDSKTRLSTLPAILQLSKAADAETRQRINQALISMIGSHVKPVRVGTNGVQQRPLGSSEFREFMTTFMDINGSETFATLRDSGLLEDKPVTANTLFLLNALANYGDSSELAPLAARWLLDEGRFQGLDEQLAWPAMTFLEDNLGWQDAAFWQAFPKLIQEHPKLGLPALLILEVPEGLAARPEAVELEKQIAQAARRTFLADDSSPQVVALAATRLASTTNVVESFRAELVGKLGERLKTLAADSERLLAVVPDNLSQLPTFPSTSTVVYGSSSGSRSSAGGSSTGGRGGSTGGSSSGFGGGGRRPTKTMLAAVSAFQLSEIGSHSEFVSMLALAVRLNAIRELDESLAAASKPILERARAFMGTLRQGNASVVDLAWPFDEHQLQQLPEPYSTFPPATWRAAKISSTLAALPNRTHLFNTQLLPVILGYTADVQISEHDKNGDGQLSNAEFTAGMIRSADANNDQLVTRDELLNSNLTALMREYVEQRFGRFQEYSWIMLSRAEAIPAIDETTFTEMDTDADDQLTLKEMVNYGMSHPVPPTSPAAPSAGLSRPNAANLEWVRRQISKYDTNQDGVLTEDEWSKMIVRPKIGTDANGDGRITVEEYAVSRE